jgi:hypothetical protein
VQSLFLFTSGGINLAPFFHHAQGQKAAVLVGCSLRRRLSLIRLFSGRVGFLNRDYGVKQSCQMDEYSGYTLFSLASLFELSI